MSFFKSLKKKLKMKDFIKGIKTVSEFIPGGKAIKASIEASEKAIKNALGKSKKQAKPTIQSDTQKLSEEKSSQNKTIMYAALAIIVGYFILKK